MTAAPQALRRATAVLVVTTGALALSMAAGCTNGDAGTSDAAGTEPASTTTEAPIPPCDIVPMDVADTIPAGIDVAAPPTLPAGVDTGYEGSGPGAGNPYLAPGARQVPGPSMTVTTLGAEPASAVVARPPNPDLGSPPGLGPDETTIPPTSVTPPSSAAPTTATSMASTTTGLMELADDPGCVALRGQP